MSLYLPPHSGHITPCHCTSAVGNHWQLSPCARLAVRQLFIQEAPGLAPRACSKYSACWFWFQQSFCTLGTEKHPGLYQGLHSIKPNAILTVQTKVGSITSAKSCTTMGSYCSTNCTHWNKTQGGGRDSPAMASESRGTCGRLPQTPQQHTPQRSSRGLSSAHGKGVRH